MGKWNEGAASRAGRKLNERAPISFEEKIISGYYDLLLNQTHVQFWFSLVIMLIVFSVEFWLIKQASQSMDKFEVVSRLILSLPSNSLVLSVFVKSYKTLRLVDNLYRNILMVDLAKSIKDDARRDVAINQTLHLLAGFQWLSKDRKPLDKT